MLLFTQQPRLIFFRLPFHSSLMIPFPSHLLSLVPFFARWVNRKNLYGRKFLRASRYSNCSITWKGMLMSPCANLLNRNEEKRKSASLELKSRCRTRNQINVNGTIYFRNYPGHCVENIKSGFNCLSGQTTAASYFLLIPFVCGPVCVDVEAAFINKFLRPLSFRFSTQQNFINR